MERKLLDMMNQLSISEYNPRMEYCDKFQFGELRKSEFEERTYNDVESTWLYYLSLARWFIY